MTLIFFQSVIHIDWNSWFDDLSTIDSYSYEVFELEHNGIAFSERTKITEDAYISKIHEKVYQHHICNFVFVATIQS